MKTFKPILILTIIMLFALLVTKSNAEEEKSEFHYKNTTLTLSGTVTAGHPDLSWNSVSGANKYTISRTTIPATGYSGGSFDVSTPGFLYTGVGAVEQSGGFCQIRYIVSAYDGTTLLATSDPIEFITTPNDVVVETGECYDPI
ncbi:MAG: hypothetical protein WDZ38_01340 [Balneolaceae bacterium]